MVMVLIQLRIVMIMKMVKVMFQKMKMIKMKKIKHDRKVGRFKPPKILPVKFSRQHFMLKQFIRLSSRLRVLTIKLRRYFSQQWQI